MSVGHGSDGDGGINSLKITVVGDGTVGKTCLLISFSKKSFPAEYTPTVYETYKMDMVVDGVGYSLALWDTAGQEGYDKLRPLSYPKTDCFILCYAVNNPASLANVVNIWKPELKLHCPTTPILLVGTKVDARTNSSSSVDPSSLMVTEKQGRGIRSKIKADSFCECSAKTMVGVEETFHEALRIAIKYHKEQMRPKRCFLL